MDILSAGQHRALAFIAACNRQGYHPSHDQINRWLLNPGGSSLFTQSMVTIANSMQWGLGMSVPQQLVELGWATDHGRRYDLTALGDVLLADAEEKAVAEAPPAVVVLDVEDPLAYANLMGILGSAGAGLLIDPYARREQVLHLASDTQINRLLVGPGLKEKDLAGIRAVLGYIGDASALQVRQSEDAHDRYLLDDEGQVHIIGSSMRTVSDGRSSTVVVPVPESSTAVIRDRLEEQWAAAQPVRPVEPPVDQTESPVAGPPSST